MKNDIKQTQDVSENVIPNDEVLNKWEMMRKTMV